MAVQNLSMSSAGNPFRNVFTLEMRALTVRVERSSPRL
jgi:hypothetical protein